MVLPRSGPQLHRKFLNAAYLAHFCLLFSLMICQVFYLQFLQFHLVYADCERQQQTLTNLHSWSHDNNKRFNVSKCKVLTITRKKKPLLQDFLLGPEKVHHVHEEKDLGVVISDKLT